MPNKVESAMNGEGGSCGHDARPRRAAWQIQTTLPQSANCCGKQHGEQRRADNSEICQDLQILVVVVPVDAQAAIGAGPA